MTSQLHDLAAPYALDALDEAEQATFEGHLAMCPDCRIQVRALREGVAVLARASADSPPAGMRERTLDAIAEMPQDRSVVAMTTRRQGRRIRRTWTVATAAAAVAVVATIGVVAYLGGGDLTAEDVVAAPDTVTIALEPTPDNPGGVAATIAFSAGQGAAAALVDGLPLLDAGLAYALWIVDGGAPIAAGLFVPADGIVLVEGPVGPGAIIAVTIEPDGGSSAPSSPILLAATI